LQALDRCFSASTWYVDGSGEEPFRRALSVEEIDRLCRVAPFHRAAVYQTIFYFGLRREETRGLKWGDFKLEEAVLRIPPTIAKNRKESFHAVCPDVVATLLKLRPAAAQANDYIFRGLVPRIPTLKRDLKAAGIKFVDARGCRADLHCLRVTFITELLRRGVDLYTVMRLARHSDIRMTMKYVDPARMQGAEKPNPLPSISICGAAQLTAQTGAVSGQLAAQPDAS
jgi:integrase/recombinase XerD